MRERETCLRRAASALQSVSARRGNFGFYSCFISYSHADKDFARRVYNDLQMKGIRCWLDEHELLPGDDIYARVDHGIRIWDKVLLCCSGAALTSWWVDNEITATFEKEQKLRPGGIGANPSGKLVRGVEETGADGVVGRPSSPVPSSVGSSQTAQAMPNSSLFYAVSNSNWPEVAASPLPGATTQPGSNFGHLGLPLFLP